MKHAILLLWHKNLQQLIKTISTFDNDFLFYIHLYKKGDVTRQEISQLNEIENVARVFSKYDVHWGGLSIVKAEILLLESITKDGIADYIHFMSGEDYLIKSIADFKSFFNRNKGAEFIEYTVMPNENWPGDGYNRLTYYGFYDWFNIQSKNGARWINKMIHFQKKIGIKRSIPNQFRCLYGGSNWMSITKECAQYIVKKKKQHRTFFNNLKHTLAPDECYFHTIILNSRFAEKTINNNFRLIIWEEGAPSPTTLTEKHWLQITTSDCLIARKFNWDKSKKLIETIDKSILTPEPLIISHTGYWKNNSLTYYSYDKGLSNAFLRLFKLMNIQTIADMGCGPAWYIASIQKLDYLVDGYEGNKNLEYLSKLTLSSDAKKNDGSIYCTDLAFPIEKQINYDLVISLGVGVYIPAQYKENFISNLVNFSERYIILCWTDQFQDETSKLNYQSNEDLIEQMRKYNFSYNSIISNLLRSESKIEIHKTSLLFFEKNISA